MKLTKELKGLNRYPFHMPGHKRNPKFNINGSEIDITEIDGFDNLHDPKGVILDLEDRLTALYRSTKSFLMVNGSTGGILSAIFAVCNEGDKIIVARNCHKSVFNACFLRKLRVIYIEPEYDSENGFYTRISQQTIDEAVRYNSDASAVVITSPTYEGYISNIECSVPLIVDSAHGAHLFDNYPKGDIVISSLHKTLPALTQTAVANIYNPDYINPFKQYIDIFETSSPSYILMASVDKCLDYIENNDCRIEKFHTKLNRLKIVEADDNGKLIISTAGTSITGVELAQRLRNDWRIEVEMASINYALLMLTVGDETFAYDFLEDALEAIDGEITEGTAKAITKPKCPEGDQKISNGIGTPTELEGSVGMRSNEFVYAYPPDIPILCPNEVITKEVIEYLRQAISGGINLISDSGLLPSEIMTMK